MKIKLKDVLKYKFDNLMSKGTGALVGILFIATAAIILIVGLLAFIFGSGTLAHNIWVSMMHVIDAGTITGADTADITFIILMSVVTLCGIFITSILIGIITTGFEEKLNSLKKGSSKVIEKNHTLILGFNDNIYTIISELTVANENQKDACIVILADEDKEEMETLISKQIQDTKSTRIICRTGSISDTHMLKQCSIETSKAIIVNEQDDFAVTKAVLAINNCFADGENGEMKAHIVATVNDEENFEAIKVAGDGKVEAILTKDAISRIIAQTCRQPGLSNVLVELFDYSGNELYFENFPQLAGKKFGDVLNYFPVAALFGFKRGKDTYLNPSNDTVLEKDDIMILLAEDDGMACPMDSAPKLENVAQFKAQGSKPTSTECILILGINDMLEKILCELDSYFISGSKIIIASDTIDEYYKKLNNELKNIDIEIVECDITRRFSLNELMKKNIDHVLLLSSDECDTETSDAMTLLKLIHLRDIAQEGGKTFNITSEMKSTVNQKLANVARVNDLVVGSNIVNLILSQIAENRDLAKVFRELLHVDGSEIYLRKASNYIKTGIEIDFFTITEIVKEKNEIAIGYKRQIGDTFEIITSPRKADKIVFGDEDYIVVLSSD